MEPGSRPLALLFVFFVVKELDEHGQLLSREVLDELLEAGAVRRNHFLEHVHKFFLFLQNVPLFELLLLQRELLRK